MSVYVDNARIHFRGWLMCHMFADTQAELHEMAAKLGLKRSWYQRGSVLAHYDVCLTKRNEAIRRGAILVGRQFLIERIRASREWKEAECSTLPKAAP